MTDHTGSVASAWREAWADRAFRIQAIITLPVLVVVLSLLARFLERNEMRQGVVLSDPLLTLFSPHDVTWITFGLIYIGLITAIVYLLRHPATLLIAMQSYALLVVFRIIAMTLVPLEPPPSMLALKDPLVEVFGTGRLLTKDLFFSGHTSTLFLLFQQFHRTINASLNLELDVQFLSACHELRLLLLRQASHVELVGRLRLDYARENRKNNSECSFPHVALALHVRDRSTL